MNLECWMRQTQMIYFSSKVRGVTKFDIVVICVCLYLWWNSVQILLPESGGILYRADSGETIWNAKPSHHLSNNIPHRGKRQKNNEALNVLDSRDVSTSKKHLPNHILCLQTNLLHTLHFQRVCTPTWKVLGEERFKSTFYCCCLNKWIKLGANRFVAVAKNNRQPNCWVSQLVKLQKTWW